MFFERDSFPRTRETLEHAFSRELFFCRREFRSSAFRFWTTTTHIRSVFFFSHHIEQVAAPESVLKRRKRDEQWAAQKAKDAAEAKKAQEKKREEVFKRAEKYVKEYEAQEKDLIWLKERSKSKGRLLRRTRAKVDFRHAIERFERHAPEDETHFAIVAIETNSQRRLHEGEQSHGERFEKG